MLVELNVVDRVRDLRTTLLPAVSAGTSITADRVAAPISASGSWNRQSNDGWDVELRPS